MTRNDALIPLPKEWPKHARSAMIHVICLARLAFTGARERASRNRRGRVRLQAEIEAARAEIALLERELEIKDLRMSRVPSRERPHHRPAERLAILELRAARGWSRRQTASRFFLQPATVAAWVGRVEERGATALLEDRAPANRLPDFVRRVVRRLKALCPAMGKKRIAQTLARAGLVLATSTVGRLLKERGKRPPTPDATPAAEATAAPRECKPVTARRSNDVWQLDLTLAPTAAGFWTVWFPFAMLQIWPFSWWIACVVDQYSRRVLGFRAFRKEPSSLDMRAFLAGLCAKLAVTPRYVVTDKGRQFDSTGFRSWCRRRGIRPCYAAAGSLHASGIRVPLRRRAMHKNLATYARWFETYRPHQGLGGSTPVEFSATSNSAKIERPVINRLRPFELLVRFHEGRRQLPIVELRQAG